MAEPTKSPSVDDVVWIYGTFKKKNKLYEFHPKLQDHIETSYQNGKQSCKLYVFGVTWTLDFKKMVKYREFQSTKDKGKRRTTIHKYQSMIKRIKRKDIKKYDVLGVSGLAYETGTGFQQTDPNCNVCLYKITIPTRIETCGHVFCYMCLKNNYTMGMECPTCRSRIPSQMFDVTISNDLDIHMKCPDEYIEDCSSMFDMSPEAKGTSAAKKPLRRSLRTSRVKYYWIYESRLSGWYRYDPKNERYIEEAYARKKASCTLFICGYKMTIHINEKYQDRVTNGISHTRRIKRILSTELERHCVKGIAGIRGYVKAIE